MLPFVAPMSAASTDYASSSASASTSRTGSPQVRSRALDDSVVLDLADPAVSSSRPSTDSDPYDSSNEGASSSLAGSSVRSRSARTSLASGISGGGALGHSASGASLASTSGASAAGHSVHYGGWATPDDGLGAGFSYGGSSRVSSRANSPAPTPDGLEGYLSYRTTSRNRSRNPSGTHTPVDSKEPLHGPEYYHNHHYQTSALLRKLGGTLAPETSPVLGRKQRKPGWWARRAETRRKLSVSHSSSGAPLLGPTGSSKTGRDRSCFSTFVAALLRQPWFPTQPFTILFSFLLLGCFAATLTTFLVNVLSSDREPPPWRQYCQEQRPFPHDLADALKPVNVFVGVFSVDAAADRRNAIRLSYAKHSKPVDPRTGKPAHNVQLKFILGRPRAKWAKRIALEMEMFNDMVVLDVEENMNKGKTFRYFEWASENATVPVYYSRPGEAGLVDGVRQVGVGFKRADYVVKADDDAFIVLSELERHLRITPRENTYWGYLIRQRFMAGEVYALSSDLVQYLATYPRPKSWRIGKEDQRVAKWMRNHPNASSIHWITERCQIYDHPKAGTTYSRGFTFPDHLEQVRLEGRRGISEDERMRRGGELWQSYSTVSTWKRPYSPPASGLSIEEEVEALVEGGGRWATQGWRSDSGRGPEAVKLERVLFSPADARLTDPSYSTAPGSAARHPAAAPAADDLSSATGVRPGAPDRSVVIPSARTTRFGKDLFRDPEGVRAVSHLRKRAANVQEGPTRAPLDEGEYEIFNLARGPFEDGPTPDALASGADATAGNSSSSSGTGSSSHSSAPSSAAEEDPAYVNEPTAQIRLGQHAYALPLYDERFLPAPTLRFEPSTLALRSQRMLGLAHGGTVAVHYLKRNEWFFETALALIGRDKMWDGGVDAPAYPGSPYEHNELLQPYAADPLALSALPPPGAHSSSSSSSGAVEDLVELEVFPALWGGARMYGSPIVTPDGMVVEGRRAEANRERLVAGSAGGARGAARAAAGARGASPVAGAAAREGRLGRVTGGGRGPLVMVAEMDGVSIEVGDGGVLVEADAASSSEQQSIAESSSSRPAAASSEAAPSFASSSSPPSSSSSDVSSAPSEAPASSSASPVDVVDAAPSSSASSA
ncbi:hypothetical protein JCM8208_001843 [Rhodotorula glutinis]